VKSTRPAESDLDQCQIIVINGVSSAGKTSFARALQTIAAQPFLHVQLDTFMQMLPPSCKVRSDGSPLAAHSGVQTSTVVINTDAVVMQARKGMRHAVAAMAGQGLRIVIDDLLDEMVAAEYRDLLAPFRTCVVGLFAPLDVLEARERSRGDRVIGLARSQIDFVHKNIVYDLTIDTSTLSPMHGASKIKQKLNL
jgi:chloramphenicol 3-O phosphotransferase